MVILCLKISYKKIRKFYLNEFSFVILHVKKFLHKLLF
jgi:hypothetical protein